MAFLVVSRGRPQLRVVGHGIVPQAGDIPPVKQLRDVLEERQLRSDKLVIVAPRSQLEVTTAEVPIAEGGELASLVRAEVDAQLGDGEQTLVSDFCRLDGHPGQRASLAALARVGGTSANGDGEEEVPESTETISAAAFALEQPQLDRWRAAAAEHDFSLLSVTSRQVAPLASLLGSGLLQRRLTVLVAVYAGEVELSFIRGSRLALLRTFRVSSNTVSSLCEQIQIEVQRSLSMVDFGTAGNDAEMVLLERQHGDLGIVAEGDGQAMLGIGDDELGEHESSPGNLSEKQWRELVETLDARAVRLQPAELTAEDAAAEGIPEPSLAGAAVELAAGELAIDLMHPKQPAAPPNPVRRWSMIGALAVASLAIVGYLLWSDVQTLRGEVEAAETELEKAEAMAAKLQEEADETRYVQQWLGDQVNWLDQLRRLSLQFPDGQGANVRRLSAQIEGDYGVFDLSIQVSDPSRVAELENRLRSADFAVTSEQISEQAANAEYPWQFEARVAFPLAPLEQREETLTLVVGPSLQGPREDGPALEGGERNSDRGDGVPAETVSAQPNASPEPQARPEAESNREGESQETSIANDGGGAP